MKVITLIAALAFPLMGYAQTQANNEKVFYQVSMTLDGAASCSVGTRPTCAQFRTIEAKNFEDALSQFKLICASPSSVPAECECSRPERTSRGLTTYWMGTVNRLPIVSDLSLIEAREKLDSNGNMDLSTAILRSVIVQSCSMK